MSSLMIGLMLLAALHFVYESILAPSMRLELRFDLFRLRDELRQLKAVRGADLEDRHFEYLHDAINALISVLYRLDAVTLLAFEQQRRRDDTLKKRSDDRARILDDCDIPEAREIWNKCIEIAVKAVAVNNGAFFGLIFPAVVALACYGKAKATLIRLISLSGNELQRVLPEVPVSSSLS